MAVNRRTAPPTQNLANFGDMGFYSTSLGLPEGKYAVEFTTAMFQPTKKNGAPSGSPFLAVIGQFYPLSGGDPTEHVLGMGRQAHNAFVPSADGKGIVPVPGGSGSISDNSAWGIFLRSLYDCGMPPNAFTNSLAAIDGVHVQTQNIPEPDSWKELRAKNATGEVAEGQEGQKPREGKVSIVVEILEDGKPWEGTGGIPDGSTPATPAPKAAAKPGPKGIVKPPPAAAEPVAADDADIEQAALSGIASVIEANPNGLLKLKLRTGTFASIKASAGDDMAQAVGDTYFSDDKALGVLLNQLGYKIAGANVVPQ